VYEGLTFKLSLKFPTGYPYEAPAVTFNPPSCFHPNVDQYGNICLDILKEKWSAVYNVRTILLSIQSLLGARLSGAHTQTRTAQGQPALSHFPLASPSFAHTSARCAISGDPNLDSPLNGHAASLWPNQADFKKALLKHKSSLPSGERRP